MKRITLAIFTILLALTFSSSKLFAAEQYFLFWYPGEAGSTSEAKPMIDLFIEKINEKIAPEKVKGIYINDSAEGLAFIAKQKPAIAIVSFSAWKQNQAALNGEVVLSTLPMPSGKNRENYSLVGPSSGKTSNVIFSSEPLSINFVKENLFGKIPADAKISRSAQILSELKNIGESKSTAMAILTPSETFTLSKLSSPWAKSITTIETSKEVPSARVIVLNGQKALTEKISKVLLDIGKTDEEKEILSELRLKGFSSEK